jgi:hypothetical protein
VFVVNGVIYSKLTSYSEHANKLVLFEPHAQPKQCSIIQTHVFILSWFLGKPRVGVFKVKGTPRLLRKWGTSSGFWYQNGLAEFQLTEKKISSSLTPAITVFKYFLAILPF